MTRRISNISAEKAFIEGRIVRQDYRLDETAPVRVHYRQFTETLSARYDMHYPLELGVILRGRMIRKYTGFDMECAPGDVWLCGIWEPHGFCVPKLPCAAVTMLFLPQSLSLMRFPERPDFNPMAAFGVRPAQRPRTASASRKEVLAIADRIVAERSGRNDPLRLRLFATELLLVVAENWKLVHQPGNMSADAHSRLNPAIVRILESQRPVRTSEAASLCRLGRNTFSRLFREAMGIPFSQFDLRYRLHGAADELAGSKKPAKAIAFEWGFANLSHLHRRFVEHFGCSPADYRLQRQTVRTG